MWQPYLTVIRERCSQAIHILDRFPVVAKMNTALDQVRAGEACRLGATPATERAFTDPKQFRRLHLAQLQPLRAAKNIRETHPAYPLVNARPVHEIPQYWRST